jgi:pimeloyl-ACP methyl ester carboxylesterase
LNREIDLLMQKNKRLVVIVPGSRTKESRFRALNALLHKFYSHFGVEVVGDEWPPDLQASFAELPAETFGFHWSGGISPFAIRKAARELKRFLHRYEDRDILLFTKSLGGAVGRIVAHDTNLPIRRIVYVARPHCRFERSLPDGVQAVNVYSPADTYQQLGNRVLFVGLGTSQVPGIRNISLPGLRHSDFDHNIEIEYRGEKTPLFDLYKKLLDGSLQ